MVTPVELIVDLKLKKTVIIDIKSVEPHSANNIREVGGNLFTDFHIRTLPRQLFKTGIHQS